MVALTIIAVCVLGAAVALAVYLPRRRREKLRRRGIKNHRTEPTVRSVPSADDCCAHATASRANATPARR